MPSHPLPIRWLASCLAAAVCAWMPTAPAMALTSAPSFAGVIQEVQPKIVKIFGAGGFRGLEAYQSGFLISAEGHILTAYSYVLDSEVIAVTLDDGRRFDATLLGADPRMELALLKIDAQGLPHFDLSQAATAEAGSRVLAFSNLFGVATGDEPSSVQHGTVAVKSRLEARRGVYETPYTGPAYILDAMTNNPGAPGGALTDRQGRLLGMLGKELRNSLNNTWLNYAIPVEEMTSTVAQIREGKFIPGSAAESQSPPEQPLNSSLLGLALVPDVLERTPPFIDAVHEGSPAAAAGLKPDDLVLFVNDRLVQSCKALVAELGQIDRADKVKLTVIRGGQELVDVELSAPDEVR